MNLSCDSITAGRSYRPGFWRKIVMRFQVVLALLAVLLLAVSPVVAEGQEDKHSHGGDDAERNSSHRDEKGHFHHSFEDAERWAALFESADRDEWQRSEDVILFLELAPDDVIADIGSATGFFPVRFAPRLSKGKVYGIDIEPDMVRYLKDRAQREGFDNIESILGEPDNPNLPEAVDLVFICNTYHHIENRVDYLRRLIPMLRRGGRIAIVDFKKGELPIGPPAEAKIDRKDVIAEFEEAGFSLKEQNGALPYQYMLMFTPSPGTEVMVSPATLQKTISEMVARYGAIPARTRFVLEPGVYNIKSKRYRDETCGNCEEERTAIEASVGLTIAGMGVVLEGVGRSPEDVVIHTGAGYGVLFQDCRDCVIRNIKITGGIRDADSRATSGAVVAKRSSVIVEDCLIEENVGDPSVIDKTVVGIIGIVGRRGADLTIRRNRIRRNSWDGIALYRGAIAQIEDNIIDGVDLARGRTAGGGRGVGIGVTWDAKALIRHNLVRRYWKGIGIFVDADCDVQENVVEEMLTWGIAYWDAGHGKPSARIARNIVFDTGACGISITRQDEGDPPPGLCRDNLLMRTGQNPQYDNPDLYCRQMPVAVQARPDRFELGGNIFFENRRPGAFLLNDDLTEPEFRERGGELMSRLSKIPALQGATCFSRFR